jgi:hypothetical protein
MHHASNKTPRYPAPFRARSRRSGTIELAYMPYGRHDSGYHDKGTRTWQARQIDGIDRYWWNHYAPSRIKELPYWDIVMGMRRIQVGTAVLRNANCSEITSGSVEFRVIPRCRNMLSTWQGTCRRRGNEPPKPVDVAAWQHDTSTYKSCIRG